MRRLLLCLVVTACGSTTPEDDDTSGGPTPPVVGDTDAGLPPGDARSGSISGTRFFIADNGTSVGSFEPCAGPVTFWVAETELALDFSCTFDNDDLCSGSVRGAPLAGPWPFDWSCEGVDGTGEVTVDVAPPGAVEAATSFSWAVQGGAFEVGLQLTEP